MAGNESQPEVHSEFKASPVYINTTSKIKNNMLCVRVVQPCARMCLYAYVCIHIHLGEVRRASVNNSLCLFHPMFRSGNCGTNPLGFLPPVLSAAPSVLVVTV